MKILLSICLLFIVIGANAQSRSKLAISQDVFEKMQEAQEMMDEKQYSQASSVLNAILQRPRMNSFELAQTWSLIGNLHFHQEDYDKAINAFKKAVEYPDLPEGFLQITLRTLAQLNLMQDNLADALRNAQRLESIVSVPDPINTMLIAQVYYRQEKMKPALDHALKAIRLERESGRQIPENWLLVLNAIYYEQGQYRQIVDVLKELIALYPKKAYVMNLAAIYGQLEQTEKQLLLMEPLYDKGMLDNQTEIMNLANLMTHHRVPYKGAKIIEKAIKDGIVPRNPRNLELLAQSWQLAAETDKSVQYFAEAANASGDHELYLRLAQSYMSLYRWSEAEKALEKAVEGELRRKGDALLMLGMSRFYQKNYRAARKAFRSSEEYPETEKLAVQWISYLESEKAKQEAAEGVKPEPQPEGAAS